MATSEPRPGPSQSTAAAPAQLRAAGENRGERTRLRLGGLLVTLTILLSAGGLVVLFATRWDLWVGESTRQTTDDAYLRSDITPLSAKIEGYVRRVPVNDFEQVKKGDLLVEIEDDDYRARLDEAQAEMLGAEAAIDNLKTRKALQHTQIAEAQDAISATLADVVRTREEAARQQALLASTFGTRQRVEQADADAKRFAASLERNQAALQAAQRQMAVLDTEEAELRAEAKAKQAAFDLAKIELGYTRIAAPIDGMVSERGVRAGQYVHDGTQVISVVPLKNVWAVANYKETQLTHVKIGQRAEITVDTFPGVVIMGRVDSVSPASGSQFTLLPPDNATGNFTKVVQRIPVKITLDPDHPLVGRLRPGMSVVATIRTDAGPATR
jgi:membrane fusion protein (multidrug efflux system)